MQRVRTRGSLVYDCKGLFSFNRFMCLYILITRHSKEQAVKEQRKSLHERRRAYRLRAWAEYAKIV